MHEAIDKRNFFLALSVVNGQRIAHSAGFAVPSEDVQQGEVLDIIQKWILLSGSGIMEQVTRCIDWTVDVTQDDMSEEDKQDTREVLLSYSAAVLSHLRDKGMLQLSPDLVMTEEHTQAFIRDLFETVIEDFDE
jgi:flagellar motor component MotA